MRKEIKIEGADIQRYKQQLLEWSREENPVILLDSHYFSQKQNNLGFHDYEFLVAIGARKVIKGDEKNGFNTLKSFLDHNNDWLFGYFTYDMKNALENLSSANTDHLNFPAIYFFQPEFVFYGSNGAIYLQYFSADHTETEMDEMLDSIRQTNERFDSYKTNNTVKSRFTKREYLETVDILREHIKRGDIYEINFCQEFYAENEIEPYATYQNLSHISPSPFGCFLKADECYLLSSSPERFLRKKGNRLISQPIKGTARRGRTEEEDNQLKSALYYDKKERAENVMIVDLVRNDLSRTARPGTVKVDELYGIYTFKQVHQMISTISCEIDPDDYLRSVKNCFPMGSMTGAPKVRAMQLIEKYEKTKRGLYSGAVGYFTPQRDFDFNVVIRSILYNSRKKYVSYSVGGAITYLSDPLKEYEECLVKAEAMKKVLNM